MSAADARAVANAAQLQASDPSVSAFVSASAGSGKTKLLTDRLLRLMLDNVPPERIQCLTFTKAAAAEMALRLRGVLAEWVRLDDAGLDGKLRDLDLTPTPSLRTTARSLFGKVLDLPGGMRIGTIHAFCQSVLRRFPLEAAISPHFRLVDERDTEEALAEATETVMPHLRASASDALSRLASVISAPVFADLIKSLNGARSRLAPALAMPPGAAAAAIRRALSVSAADEEEIIARAVRWPDENVLRDAAHVVANAGSTTVQATAGRLLDWLALDEATRSRLWEEEWLDLFQTGQGKPRAAGAFMNPKLQQARPDLLAVLLAEQERVFAVEAARRDLRAADLSAALLAIAGPLLTEHGGTMQRAGLLDYDDLISRTEELLREPGAGWVLYKLDGGLDHLLLDEVQDTAPAQWRIAGALTDEFFAGAGARGPVRTIFAVGDRKQSIFSFQGADPDGFDHWKDHLGARVNAAEATFRDVPLYVSFRSTAPILALTDAVFSDTDAADGVLAPGDMMRHLASRAGEAGRIELLPLLTADKEEPPPPWAVARENRTQASARQKLADGLAHWIRRELDAGTMLESLGRPLQAGDILVLVRRRDAFAAALVRALKARGVPVGGLDRIVLVDQPAVQDLIALGDSLLLPADDLAFANWLVSPLGGLTHDSLEALALGRAGSLRQALRARAAERPDWHAAEDFFATLLGRADYISPHALFVEALGALGGRARLFSRLGAEAEEPVAEFLQAALSYTQLHPPSLQGFLHWLARSGAEVKREAEESGGAVRIMTVHGAKGLQERLVILPDTTALPPDDGTIHWLAADGIDLPICIPNGEYRGAIGAALREAAERRRQQEYNRLLYVALTRAQDRLVVCGWQGNRAPDPKCWYRRIEAGFARLDVWRDAFDLWPGEALRMECPQTAPLPEPRAVRADLHHPLPPWAGAAPDWCPHQPPQEPDLPEPLAPSRPEGADLGAVPAAASPLEERAPTGARFQRGKLVHALLQHLPALPPAVRAASAREWLARRGQGLPPAQAAELAQEVLAILDHNDLAPLFGPNGQAEVPLTGVIAGKVIGGLVDRLAVEPDRVLVADYKTNRDQPARPEDTPVLYLRQLAAYRAVLRAVFPDRRVECALVWTRSARAVMLPPDLLDRHAPGAA